MKISIYKAGFRRLPIAQRRLRQIIRSVLLHEGIQSATLRLILADDATIQALNRQYLQHDYPTDVLTFVLESEPLEAEIYIGGEQAHRQAAEYGIPVSEELIRLSIHGVLHALGYNDQTPQERRAMHARQEYYVHFFTHRATEAASEHRAPPP